MTPEHIILTVSNQTGISRTDMIGRTRTEGIVFARWCAMALMHELTSLGVTDIGRFMHKDHSAVKHGITTLQDWIETNPKRAVQFRQIENELKGVE